MTWEAVWKIISAAILSAGGIGAVIVAVVCFSANKIADRLSKKYDLKLEQELEKYKTTLSQKEYITKTRFDAEFAVFRELNSSFFVAVRNINSIIPSTGVMYVPVDPEERKRRDIEHYDEANKASIHAQDVLNENISFIPQKFYERYDELLSLCYKQLDIERERYVMVFGPSAQSTEDIKKPEDYERTEEINELFLEIGGEVREYFDSLEVIE